MTDMYNAGLMLTELTGYKRNMDTFGFAGDIVVDVGIVIGMIAVVLLAWYILDRAKYYSASESVLYIGGLAILIAIGILGFCCMEYHVAEWKYEPLAETYHSVFGPLPWE